MVFPAHSALIDAILRSRDLPDRGSGRTAIAFPSLAIVAIPAFQLYLCQLCSWFSISFPELRFGAIRGGGNCIFWVIGVPDIGADLSQGSL
jgi:hypothetical protein